MPARGDPPLNPCRSPRLRCAGEIGWILFARSVSPVQRPVDPGRNEKNQNQERRRTRFFATQRHSIDVSFRSLARSFVRFVRSSFAFDPFDRPWSPFIVLNLRSFTDFFLCRHFRPPLGLAAWTETRTDSMLEFFSNVPSGVMILE